MATPGSEEQGPRTVVEEDEYDVNKLTKSFLGLSFSVMLACLPSDAMALVPRLTSEVKELRRRLAAAEDQLRQMKSRRVEDSKANARVVEIFASHRNAWQEEEKRLLQRIEAAEQEAYSLTAKIHDLEQEREECLSRIAELEREVGERDEMIGFMSRRGIEEEDGEESAAAEGYGTDRLGVATAPPPYGLNRSSDFLPSLVPSANRFWTETATNSCQVLLSYTQILLGILDVVVKLLVIINQPFLVT